MPVISTVVGAHQILTTQIEAVGHIGAQGHGGIPVKAQLFIAGHRKRFDITHLTFFNIITPYALGSLHLGVHIGLGRMAVHPEAIACSYAGPVARLDAARAGRWTKPATIVLQTAIHIIRLFVVHAYMVKLGHRQVIDHLHGITAIPGAVHPAIGAHIKAVGVVDIEPHIMGIGMHAAQPFEGLAAIAADGREQPHLDKHIGVARVYDNT